MVWYQLTQAKVPGITGCWIIPWGGDRPFLAIRLEQLYPGHSKQAGMMAALCPAFNYGGVVVVVMDNDLDITTSEQIFWALSTRLNPVRDIQVIEEAWGNPVFKSEDHQSGMISRVIIDATIPWEHRKKAPPLVRSSQAAAERVRTKWPHIFSQRSGK